MLMIGTNNTWHRNDRPEAIAAGIRAILDLIAKKQPQATTLLLPIFPFGSSPQDGKRVYNEKANALIKEFADGEKVVWVDFNAKFLDEKGDNVALMPDHCHPNAKGYAEVWLPSVLPYFKKACGK
jgi:beta-glucosidase